MSARSAGKRTSRSGGHLLRSILTACFLFGIMAHAASADQTDPRLDALFARLQETTDGAEAKRIEGRIWSIWLESGIAVVDLLMAEGVGAMAAGRTGAALQAFDAVVEAAPDFAEGWNKRATARYLMGDYEASMRDAEKALELEPRHFGAMSGLGLIHSALDRPEEALEWYRRALEIHPHLEGIRETVRQLAEKIEGKPI